MSQRWYFFPCFKHFITYTTMTSCRKSCLRTGWGYRIIINNCMTCCLDFFCSYNPTSLTCKCLNSCLCTGWCCYYFSIIPCVAKSRYFFLSLKHFVTYRAMTSFGKSWLCTCWRDLIIFYLCMILFIYNNIRSLSTIFTNIFY